MSGVPDEIEVGADGETVPLMDVLGGRGFVTGKSGAGKSNTASVFAEELLDCGLSLCIVDTDGEYYGLKEEYELLHAGAGERCDVQVGPEDAGTLATLALGENVPVILDCSGYLEEADARDTVTALAKQLFAREAEHRKPFLLLVEEVHEYLPQGRGLDEAGDALLRIAKRGRKRGLGLCGLSQRPAAVDKDFITQCDWLVWHRLTWKNDTDLVADLLGKEYAEIVEDLDDGEALLQADWNDDLQRIRFRRKRTFDAGATPGLEDVDRPSLQSVDEKILDAFEAGDDPASDDVEALREELAAKNDRIAELEARIEALEAEADAAESADANATSDGSATAAANGGRSPGSASSADVEIVETQTVDESTRARDERAREANGDPVWELGQMTAHLARRGGRGITRSMKSLGSTIAPTGADEESADGEGADEESADVEDDESSEGGSTDALAPMDGRDDE
ncbi:DUF87 domain-containing protein [Halorubellus sp. JP-L1]|uniref:ATP-binding protein n=1 Tax=Halorubellus sp. JP-L1 TaxID=2715753 RepID=UPI00140AF711|nr:DUF87 domain-containing protein [Halorubellus sp. JP-L1]NHN42628.1 DUF87 domain-containing protein [Halorubellus sp. JP-L1]